MASPSASERLSGHFHLGLPSDVAEWFDAAPSRTNCAFNECIQVDRLLNPHSSAVWGGQMLPDTLPFLHNGGGDKLCLRFNADGTLREIIRWNHEDGSWLPCGESIASALAYVRMLEGKDPGSGNELSRVPALHLKARQFLQSGLHNAATSLGGQRIAKIAEMSWPEYQARAFDPSLLLLEQCRQRIAAELSRSPAELFSQDWDTAATAASEVIALRPDLAWPFAVAGWALERRGRTDEAARIYALGIWSLDTTADFTGQWNPPPLQRRPKFCAGALVRFKPDHVPEATAEFLRTADDLEGVRSYWIERAEFAESQGHYEEAYEFTYRAGWDVYCTDMMGDILDRLIRIATMAQRPALAALAAHHGSAM